MIVTMMKTMIATPSPLILRTPRVCATAASVHSSPGLNVMNASVTVTLLLEAPIAGCLHSSTVVT